MSRHALLVAIIISTLSLMIDTANAQEAAAKTVASQRLNQVYVKLIMPTDAVDRNKDRNVIESWIVDDLEKFGQSNFTAVTGWVSLDLSPFGATDVWNGVLGDHSYCPVGADIPERGEGRIKLLLNGWTPGGGRLNMSLVDEPGHRRISAVDEAKTDSGTPYVAVLIGPPSETPIDRKKQSSRDEH